MPTGASAQPTQEQIAAALGSSPGQTWSLTAPDSSLWAATGTGLVLGTIPAGSVSAAETTFKGPGVAALEIQNASGAFEVSVWVDGALAGARDSSGTGIQRVGIGAGDHTVRWELLRTAANSSTINSLALTNAKWEPFTGQSLSAGVTGDNVALASPGTNPWIGQTAWHHGDGAAAWSGLKLNSRISNQVSTDAPLRATFDGPGVLTYRYRTRGDGHFTFKLDNGLLYHVASSVEPQETWIMRWLPVGPGTHVMEWRAESFSYGSSRSSYDLAIDEIKLLPDVPLAVALETPGWVWTTTADSSTTPRLAGLLDSTASGGSLAAIGGDTQIHTLIAGGRVLKIRSRGPFLHVSFGDAWLDDAMHPAYPPPPGWVDSIWALPDGVSDLRIFSYSDVEIDRVELLPLPATRDLALGLPEGSTTSGGPDAWAIVPYEEIIGHGLRMEATRGNGSSWLELPVQGPATVDFSWKTGNYNPGFSLFVDGKQTDRMQTYEESRTVRIEIPAGLHTVRWLAVAPKSTDPWAKFTAIIGGIKVTQLPPGGVAMAALNLQIPLSVPSDWTASTGFSRDGTTALQGPAVTAASPTGAEKYRVKANFTGPGELSFWWRLGNSPADWGTLNWSLQNVQTSDVLLQRSAVEGWKKETVWLPPGTSLFEWVAWGTAGQVALAALDGIEFTPAALITLGEAADAPQLVWQNDPAKPWSPLVLPDPAGDMVVSPLLASGERSRISTVVRGPGTVSFHWHDFDSQPVIGTFSANGKLLHTSTNGPQDQLVEVFIPVSSPVTLEWTATASTEWDCTNSLIGVDKVCWTTTPPLPLAAALDTPATVTWRTSGDIPFVGWADPAAKGKTSAYVGLLPGESSWLEATVDGPGLFDFWLRKEANMDLPGYLWSFWSLTIDGNPVAIDGTSWPAQWITGAGKHRIRLTLRNTTGGIGSQWIASGVDDVSWIPLPTTSLDIAGGLPGQIWKTGRTQPAEGLGKSGRDGSPAILVRPGQGGTSWIGTKVAGPCEISWDSSLDEISWRSYSVQSLRVDGVNVVPVPAHSWQRMRLTLPAGNHSVYWLSAPGPADPDQPHPPLAYAAWRLSGMKIKPGISPLAQALDLAALYALETGDAGGHLVSAGKDDAWEPGLLASICFFDPHRAGKLSAEWGRPDSAGQQWDYEESGTVYPLYGESAGWQQHLASIAPGGFLKWTYPHQDWWHPARKPPLLKRLKFSGSVAKSPAAAIDSPQPLVSGSWLGLADSQAVTGLDSAWSLLNNSATSHPASLTLTGPSKVSFWWKAKGPGTLRMYLDGAFLPVAVAGGAWTKVEFAINPGSHVIDWIHAPTAETSFSRPGEARLDGLEIRAIAPGSLTQAAALDPHLDLTTTSAAPGQLPWQPVIYREASGTWTRAVRAVSGSRVLRAMVTGPAVLEFRGRCFEGIPSTPKAGPRPSVVVIGGGGQPQVLGHFLAVDVGGTGMLRIPANAAGTWQSGAVHVPAGTHEVTFRLMTLQSVWWGESIIDATVGDLQGWVDDLRLVSPASRFQAWAIAKKLPPALAGQDTDADGDGASNFLEYSFGTAPLDPTSRPVALSFGISNRGFGLRQPELRIPYLPSHASGILQSSTDLVHWQTEPTPVLHDRPLNYGLANTISTSTYQALPISMDGSQKFFRIWISDSPPAE